MTPKPNELLPCPVTDAMIEAGIIAYEQSDSLKEREIITAIYTAMNTASTIPTDDAKRLAEADETERVARAIRGRQVGYDDWDVVTEHQRDAYRSDADAAIAALTAKNSIDTQLGWKHLNPDTGIEWTRNHPVESGECEDAEEIERMPLGTFNRRYQGERG